MFSIVSTNAANGDDGATLRVPDGSLQNTLISLSNSSTYMLERGRCKSCIETIKDTFELIKSLDDIPDASLALELAQRRIADAVQNPGGSRGVVVLSSQHDPNEAYHLTNHDRASKICLTMDAADTTLDLMLVRSILVYNYGMAHRCCLPPDVTSLNGIRLVSFCLQIFQYAENLLPKNITSNLVFRFVLTRNLAMISCGLGLALCEQYTKTLDQIVADIVGPLEPEDSEQEGASAA